MGSIRLEIDLPEFENELIVSVTVSRDGKVSSYKTTKPSSPSPITEEPIDIVSKPSQPKSNQRSSSKKEGLGMLGGGNMMNIELP